MADPYNLKRRGKHGYWVPDFQIYGVRVHRSTKKVSKPDAIEKCKDWVKEIEDRKEGKVPPPAPPVKEMPTLRKALETWEAEMRGAYSDKHVDGTVAKIRLHMADQMETPIDQLDTKTMRTVRAAYVRTPGPTGRAHKKGGANSLMKAVNTVIGFFVEDKTLDERPFKLKRLPVKRVPRRVVPIQDTAALLAAVDAPYKGTEKKHSPKAKPKNPHVCLAIKMMLALGLRERETLRSRWEWIDWANRTYYAGETKNGEVRLIPIPKWFLALLQSKKPGECRGLIMPADDGEAHRGQFTKKVLYEVGNDLGLVGLTPHRLRATFATNHARAGTDIRKIQVWLDHAHIETTMLYIEYVDEGGHAAQDRVEKLMGLSPTPPKVTQIEKQLKTKTVNNDVV